MIDDEIMRQIAQLDPSLMGKLDFSLVKFKGGGGPVYQPPPAVDPEPVYSAPPPAPPPPEPPAAATETEEDKKEKERIKKQAQGRSATIYAGLLREDPKLERPMLKKKLGA